MYIDLREYGWGVSDITVVHQYIMDFNFLYLPTEFGSAQCWVHVSGAVTRIPYRTHSAAMLSGRFLILESKWVTFPATGKCIKVHSYSRNQVTNLYRLLCLIHPSLLVKQWHAGSYSSVPYSDQLITESKDMLAMGSLHLCERSCRQHAWWWPKKNLLAAWQLLMSWLFKQYWGSLDPAVILWQGWKLAKPQV